MDNNLPKDPPDSGNNNPTPASPSGGPPPFGSDFNPHSNPSDPNNPYQQPQPSVSENPNIPNNDPEDILKHDHYSEVAQHKQRDAHGHFVPSEHPTNPTPNQTTSQIPPNPSSFLPPIIEINQNTKPTDKKDPPLFGFFLTNPVTYLKAFLSRLIKRQAITIKIPVLAIIVFMVGIGGFGIGFQSGTTWALAKLFPNYSPILHREITEQGKIQKSSKGYFLQTNDKNKTIWTLQSTSANVKLGDYVNQQVQVKGNLTSTPNLIEVSEVISFDKPIYITPATNSAQPTL